MNKYSICIKWKTGHNSYEKYEFILKTIETLNFVKEAICENQKEYNFDSPVELMDYICDTYEMEWEDFEYDAVIGDING